MKQNILYVLLCICIFALLLGSENSPKNQIHIEQPRPEPISEILYSEQNVVSVVLNTNIIDNDLEEAIKLGKIHQKNIIVIYGADWCPYCVELKKAINNKSINTNDYIICLLDTDIKNNQSIVKMFKVKNLPTSILINTNKKELARKVGYGKTEYVSWLKSLSK